MAGGKEDELMAHCAHSQKRPSRIYFVSRPEMTTVESWPAVSRTPASAQRECQ